MRKTRNFALLFVLIISLAGCAVGTPLMRASFNGDINKVNALLDQGADANESSLDFTPLMFAASRGHTNIVKLLIAKGANVNARNDAGNTALHWAVYYYNQQPDIVQCLLEKGADVNITGNIDGVQASPLQLAEKKGHTQIVQMLKAAQSKYAYKAKSEHMLLIAVIDFDAKGLQRQDAVRLSEWLRTELINTGQFRVIERSAMNAILKEQAFSMTGCTDTSCAVQVGKLLSAKRMLVGSVESWSNKVFINGRIIDVEKGVAEFAHKETVNSVKDLDMGAASFAKNLARRINGLPAE